MEDQHDFSQAVPEPPPSAEPPRVLIIGAGSRGNAYARAVSRSTNGVVAGVADPVGFKRQLLGSQYIWGAGAPAEDQEFDSWQDYLRYELGRRERAASGEAVLRGVDAVFVCTLDEMHAEIIIALAPLNLHIMSEKPLATSLQACLSIRNALSPRGTGEKATSIFAIGHVLRYSPHNMLLRKLLLEDKVIGEVVSMEHTEPVGWWHFAHSYVRGNWRRESQTAPTLLTKSCHDIDLLLWLLGSPPPGSGEQAHLPSTITSTGSLVHFRRSQKPPLAGQATNCLSCEAEPGCMYSANKIYRTRLRGGDLGFPVKVVVPEIEDVMKHDGLAGAEKLLAGRLAEDYDDASPDKDARPWFGRCVYEAGNDVCDDQFVTIRWNEDETAATSSSGRGAKTASFHMVAFTEAVCERRSRVYGTRGEVEADSTTIKVHDFVSGKTQTHHPHQAGGGHGGGDDGLARQYILAVDAVKNQGMSVAEAQHRHIGCTLEDVIRSHAMVFAAEEARKGRKVVDWPEWWQREVDGRVAQGQKRKSVFCEVER